MKNLICLSIVLYTCLGGVLFAQQRISAVVKEDKSLYRFEVKVFSARHRTAISPEELSLEITMKRQSDDAVLQKKTVILSNETYQKSGDEFWVGFEIQKVVVSPVDFDVTLVDKRIGTTSHTRATFQAAKSMDFTLFSTRKDQFFRQFDTIWVQTNREQIFVYRFVDPLSFAIPPFLTKVNIPTNLEVDSLIVLSANQRFVLNKRALYFIQTDTSGQEGQALTVVAKDYPKFKVVSNLAEAMIYISDDEEYQNMKKSNYKKRVMDQQWLNFGGTQSNTLKLISSYFKRVTFANKNFLSIREGWRTDRGMIYIVFGEPLEVNEVFGQLTWTYFSASLQRRFTFVFSKVESPFSDNHYILQNRDSKLLAYWRLAVGSWRSGSDKSD